MLVRIDAHDFPAGPPGLDVTNVWVGLQKGSAPADLVAATSDHARWEFEVETRAGSHGIDVRGAYVHGRPRDRFIYLTWGIVDDAGGFTMFRRAKLMLEAVPEEILEAASGASCMLVGRLGLTDAQGGPLCAAVRPPVITWTAEPVTR